MRLSKRDELVDTALNLFYRHGFHATGIDKVLAESGVAKMTLYKHFKSKDELIFAALRRRDEQFRNWFMRAVERRGRTGAERLLAMFDALEEFLAGREFHGCAFMNACAEFARHDDPIHGACAEHKRLVLGYIRDLALAANAKEPDELARQLRLLMEGAIVTAHVTGEIDATKEARKAAGILVRHATEEPAAESSVSPSMREGA